MPNINLRLTDEEHEALRTWAFEGQRSIQKEIVWRLFRDLSVVAPVAGLSERSEVMEARDPGPGASPASPLVPGRSESPSYFPEREAKADFVQKKIK